MNKVSMKITDSYVKVYINGLLHFQVPYFKYLVFLAYKQGKSWYIIEINNKKGKNLFTGWYKEKQLFSDIVKIWDENIN